MWPLVPLRVRQHMFNGKRWILPFLPSPGESGRPTLGPAATCRGCGGEGEAGAVRGGLSQGACGDRRKVSQSDQRHFQESGGAHHRSTLALARLLLTSLWRSPRPFSGDSGGWLCSSSGRALLAQRQESDGCAGNAYESSWSQMPWCKKNRIGGTLAVRIHLFGFESFVDK